MMEQVTKIRAIYNALNTFFLGSQIRFIAY